MKRFWWIQSLVLGVSLAMTAACGSSGSSANPASASSAAAATPSINLSGTWTGKLANVNGGQNDPTAPAATWSASQSGSAVTGPLSLVLTDDGGTKRTIAGTLSGTMSGTQMSLNLSFPSGTFPEAAACSISGAGTGTATATSISSTIALAFAAPCVGTVVDRASETDQLTLNKS